MQTELVKFITLVFSTKFGQTNSYNVRLGLRKIREVLNHSLLYLKIVNPSVHQIKVGLTI
jgi:hypothetical protein